MRVGRQLRRRRDLQRSSEHQEGLLLSESSGTWTDGVKATLPAGAATNPNVYLTSVSCPSAGDCAAVGAYNDSSQHQLGLLLSESSGTWTAGVKATLPADAKTDPSVDLTSVACPSAASCVAVGRYTNSSDTRGLLVGGNTVTRPAPGGVRPAIAGRTRAGQRLLASTGSWSGTRPLTFSYQWQRCRPSCANISGATGRNYTPRVADVDARLRVLITARNSAGSAQAESAKVGPVAPSVAQINGWLLAHLAPSGKAAKIAAVLKNGAYTYALRSLGGGRLTIAWYYLPNGSTLKAPNRKPKPVLIATGTASFTRAGAVKLTVKLTKPGKQMVTGSRSLKLVARGTYTPTGEIATTAIKPFTLKR